MRREPELIATLRDRARILTAIRSHFDGQEFVEVTSPSLVLAPDPAAHLDPFRTEFHCGDEAPVPMYLPTSPEHHMKRMVAAGMERIYQLTTFFRNGEMTPLHNPEFTGLEWYQAGADLPATMDQAEQLVRHVAASLPDGPGRLPPGPFRRMSVRQVLSELAGVDVPPGWDEPGLRVALQEAGISTASGDRFDDLVHRAMLERVEPALEKLGPAFVHGYPVPMASQARLAEEGHGWIAERFELYAGGLELCNGYAELTDAAELRARFERERKLRHELGKPDLPLDEAYLGALDAGFPDCGGCALGVDRLVMWLCGKRRIEDVMAFPLSLELKARRQV